MSERDTWSPEHQTIPAPRNETSTQREGWKAWSVVSPRARRLAREHRGNRGSLVGERLGEDEVPLGESLLRQEREPLCRLVLRAGVGPERPVVHAREIGVGLLQLPPDGLLHTCFVAGGRQLQHGRRCRWRGLDRWRRLDDRR